MRPAEVRVQNEAEFHNAAYEGQIRKSASFVYELMENCSRYYRQFLKAQCAGKQVLEYGCGEHSVAPFLCSNGMRSYDGIDISSFAIEEARNARIAGDDLGQSVKYHVMNAEALEFEDNSFDLICGIAILHHLDLEKAYSEIARTLRPGGAAIFLEPLAYNPVVNLYRRLTPRLRTPDEHPFLMRDIKMAASSFAGVETRFYNLFTLLSLASSRTSLFPALRRGLDCVDRGAFACCPPLRRYAWTVSLVLTSPRKSASPRVFGGSAGTPAGI